jgi:hypothetical protein
LVYLSAYIFLTPFISFLWQCVGCIWRTSSLPCPEQGLWDIAAAVAGLISPKSRAFRPPLALFFFSVKQTHKSIPFFCLHVLATRLILFLGEKWEPCLSEKWGQEDGCQR